MQSGITDKVHKPSSIVFRLTCNAWQGASQPRIEEELIGQKEQSLDQLLEDIWFNILEETTQFLKIYLRTDQRTV
jgi:hypothetical protein